MSVGQDSTDDCVFRAMEGLKLSRQVGDRTAVLEG